jgi:acetyl esterase/lipase
MSFAVCSRDRRDPAHRRPSLPAVWGVCGVVFIALSQLPVDAAGRLVTFRASDGRTVTGLFVEADARPAPAVVLVPMLGRPRDDWQIVAQRLAEARISALAIDLRDGTTPGDPEALVAWHEDIRAAVAFLAAIPSDVLPGAIGVAGASLGANLAAVAAGADPAIRSLVLVSPSLDYRGVRIEGAMRAYDGRPALLMASLHDPYAARSIRELAHEARGPRELKWSNIPAHGSLLLQRDADLVRSMVEWFQLTLG